MSLKRSVIGGLKWTAASHVVARLLSLITSVVLARLLAPSDFGLVAMAMVILGFVDLFSSLGTAAAVIRQKTLPQDLLSSLFWTNVLFGLFATGMLILLAPLAAAFYREARLTSVMQWLALTLGLAGFRSVPQALMQRDFAFERLAKLEIGSSCIGLLVGVGAALFGFGVWSLVVQSLVMNIFLTCMIWLANPWRPQFVWKWTSLKGVASFSLNLTAYNVFNYFARNADNFLIGRYLGVQSLGYYDLAYRCLLYPLAAIASTVGRVILPAYSRIQDDNAQFRAAFLKIASIIAVIAFPAMVGLAAVCEPFVLTVFGVKWAPIVPVLMILAPVGAAQSVISTIGNIYQAKGRTDLMFKWGAFAGSLSVIAFIIGLKWGIVGVAAAYAVCFSMLIYPGLAIPLRLIEMRVSTFGRAIWRTLAATLTMLGVVVGVKALLPPRLGHVSELALLVLASALSYTLAALLINRKQLLDLKRFLWS